MTTVSSAEEAAPAAAGAEPPPSAEAPPPVKVSPSAINGLGGALDDLLMNGDDSPRRGGEQGGLKHSNWRPPAEQPPAPSAPLVLRHRWNFGTIDSSHQRWNPQTFGSLIKTVEELWQHLNNIRLPSHVPDTHIYLFKERVTPQWESPQFCRPGAGRLDIRIQCNDRESTSMLTDLTWLHVILSAVGGDNFAAKHEDIINGLVCQFRPPGRNNVGLGRVEIWVAADKISDGDDIRDHFERGFWENVKMLEKEFFDSNHIEQSSQSLKLQWKTFARGGGGGTNETRRR